MRIAAHHRGRGDEVELRMVESIADLQPRLGDPAWCRVYGSLIVEWSRPIAIAAQRIYPSIELGGTGWDFEDGTQIRKTDLPADIASTPPDYSVYPWFANSIGFAQRGCRFACTFCVVPIPGPGRDHATLPSATIISSHPPASGLLRALVVVLLGVSTGLGIQVARLNARRDREREVRQRIEQLEVQIMKIAVDAIGVRP
jgi:hypothetical protein